MSPVERVAAGVRWLDEHEPGWRDWIVVEAFDIDHECRCIFGQLYGHFWIGCDLRGLDRQEAEDLGFIAQWLVDEDDELQAAWERVLR